MGWRIPAQHLAIQEYDGIQRLILRGCGDLPIRRQMGKVGLNRITSPNCSRSFSLGFGRNFSGGLGGRSWLLFPIQKSDLLFDKNLAGQADSRRLACRPMHLMNDKTVAQ